MIHWILTKIQDERPCGKPNRTKAHRDLYVIVENCKRHITLVRILDLHVSHVGGEVQKNILSILLWAPAVVGEQHCLVIPERLVASQELLPRLM